MSAQKFLTASFLTAVLAGCGGGGSAGSSSPPQNITGTSGDDSWTVVGGGTVILDGLGGTDTLHLGTSLQSAYTIVRNTDGSVKIDSISGASSAFHATLVNMEILKFSSDQVTVDLRTYFGPPTVASFSPLNQATGVAIASNLVLTFSVPIQLGSGDILLQTAAGQTIETFTIGTSKNLSVVGNTLTVNPTADLANATAYKLILAPGNITDLNGYAFPGLNSYGFTTN